jgi:hypothetical protein
MPCSILKINLWKKEVIELESKDWISNGYRALFKKRVRDTLRP